MEKSFVTLDLEKYNEMYEKAKKFDEFSCELNNSNEDDKKNEYKFGDRVLIKGVISEIDNEDEITPYGIETESEFFWASKNDIYKKEEE